MEHRDWHGLLEEITQTEIDINTNGDPDGVKVAALHALKAEVREHPAGADGSVGTSSADLILNSASITSGQTVTISALTVTSFN